MTDSAERWTIVTDEGLNLWREDLMTRDEALQHIAEHPFTANGKTQYAVPARVARTSAQLHREYAAAAERRLREDRKARFQQLLQAYDETSRLY